MKLRETFARVLERLIPTRSFLVPNGRHEPDTMSRGVTVESLQAMIRDAESGDTRSLFALYRDIILQHGHCQSEFTKRKLAVLGNPCTFTAHDEKDPADANAAALVNDAWSDLPGKREALTHLLDSSLYPVSVVEKTFEPMPPGAPVRYRIKALRAVPHHLLDFLEGRLRIRNVDDTGMPLSTFHEPDPNRYIVHRGHLLTSIPDQWGGPMRAVVFWWLFATMDREWWGRFLERFGAPFMVGYHPDEDGSTKASLKRAFSAATRLFGLVVPIGAKIDLLQAQSQSGGEAFQKFAEFANGEISKIIVGQTMTSESKPQGIGGSQALVHDRVRGDVRDFDEAALAETIREQLIRQWMTINGVPGRAPMPSWSEASDEDAQAIATLLTALPPAGLRIKDEAIPILSQRLGLQLERAPEPAPALPSAPPVGFSAARPDPVARRRAAHAASDRLQSGSAPVLSRAFRENFADIERIIRESTSAADLEERLTAFAAAYAPGREATLLAEVMASGAANAA